MSYSKNSYVGQLLNTTSSDQPDADKVAYFADILSQCNAITSRAVRDAEVYREIGSIDFNEEEHAELLDFIGGVGRVVSEQLNEIRDRQERRV